MLLIATVVGAYCTNTAFTILLLFAVEGIDRTWQQFAKIADVKCELAGAPKTSITKIRDGKLWIWFNILLEWFL